MKQRDRDPAVDERSLDVGTKPRTPGAVLGALIAGGLLLLTMVVLLAMTLSEITTSRTHIEDTDAQVARLLELSQPTLEETAPLARRARPLISDAQPVVRSIAENLPSVVATGRAIAPTLDRLPALVVAGQALISEAFPAVETLGDSGLVPTLAAVRSLTFSLLEGGRLAETLDDTRKLIDQAATLDLPTRAVRASQRIARVLDVQRRTLAVQKRSVAVQKRTLDTQLAALRHIRSIDNKTGGQLPTPRP